MAVATLCRSSAVRPPRTAARNQPPLGPAILVATNSVSREPRFSSQLPTISSLRPDHFGSGGTG